MALLVYGSEDQRAVIQCSARFMGVFAGRRWGKTVTARGRIITRTAASNFQYWYVSPNYSQAIEEFESLVFNQDFASQISRTKQQPYPQIWLKNGSRIGYRSFDRPEALRSRGLDEIWVDEIQNIEEKDFWPVIRPLISDRRGTLIVSGQFRGKNWYYEEFFLKGQDPKQTLFRSWAFPSSSGLMYQGERGRAELELARVQVPPPVWDQEFDCIPASNMVAVFPPMQLERIVSGTPKREAEAGKQYCMGLDLGRIADQSAIVVLECDTGIIVHAEKLPFGMEHALQAVHAAEVAQRYNACVVIDSTGGATGGHAPPDSYVKFYRERIRALREFYWSAQNKEKIIAELCLAIQQKKVLIPAVSTGLLEELHAYEYTYKHGRYDFHAAAGEHDDYVAALAQAVWGRKFGWVGGRNGAGAGAAWL